MANRVRDWSAPRFTELADVDRVRQHAHDCRRRRCEYRGRTLPDGDEHYPHKGAICHHAGQDPSRCIVHGTLLQFYSGRIPGKPYPAGVCYSCLPRHEANCPMALSPTGSTCTCVRRLTMLGEGTHGGIRTELQESA